MKKICILGSTGSIGTQSLDVIRQNRDRFQVSALTCGSNAELLEKFIAAKRLEGRSDGTLNYSQFTATKMFEDIGKNIRAITTEDLRDYG